jgi:hypothetical protein
MLILAGGGQGFRWTMTRWSGGRGWGSSGGRGSARASGECCLHGERQAPRDTPPGALVVFGGSGRHGENAANSRKDSRSDIQRSYYLAIPSEQKGAGIFRVFSWASQVVEDCCQHSCEEAEKDESHKEHLHQWRVSA